MPAMKLGVFGKIVMIIAIIVVVALVYDLCIRLWRKMRSKEPKKTVVARAVFKEVQKGVQDNGPSYSVCFLTVDGQPLELFPSEAEFNAIKEEVKGNLTYQGSRFISFQEE